MKKTRTIQEITASILYAERVWLKAETKETRSIALCRLESLGVELSDAAVETLKTNERQS